MSHLSTIIQRVKKQADLENEENLKENVENIKDYIEAWNDYTEEELIEAYSLWHKYGPRLDDYGELPLDNSDHLVVECKDDVDLEELREAIEDEFPVVTTKIHVVEKEDDEDGEL